MWRSEILSQQISYTSSSSSPNDEPLEMEDDDLPPLERIAGIVKGVYSNENALYTNLFPKEVAAEPSNLELHSRRYAEFYLMIPQNFNDDESDVNIKTDAILRGLTDDKVKKWISISLKDIYETWFKRLVNNNELYVLANEFRESLGLVGYTGKQYNPVDNYLLYTSHEWTKHFKDISKSYLRTLFTTAVSRAEKASSQEKTVYFQFWCHYFVRTYIRNIWSAYSCIFLHMILSDTWSSPNSKENFERFVRFIRVKSSNTLASLFYPVSNPVIPQGDQPKPSPDGSRLAAGLHRRGQRLSHEQGSSHERRLSWE